MARIVNMETLDHKIEKAQQEVSAAKKKYDATTAELKKLLDKRDALRSQEIMKLIAESPLAYEEIVRLIQNSGKEDVENDQEESLVKMMKKRAFSRMRKGSECFR